MSKPTNIPASLNAKPVSDETLRQLSDLGHVPPEQREFFSESIYTIVKTACELDGLVKNGLARKRGRNLYSAAQTLYDTLGNLNGRERALIEDIFIKARAIFGEISIGGVKGLEETAYQLALLFSLVTGKSPPRYISQLPQSPGPGRRLNSVKNPIFQNFVSGLLISTTEAGGRLTLEKNIGSGSLIKAINILTPCLPDRFVPTRLPVSTLQRIKKTVRLAGEAVGELDADLLDDPS